MWRMNGTKARAGLLVAVALVLASSAMAADHAESAKSDSKSQDVTRQIVVSIPDRKLALVEDDKIVAVYEIAVGKNVTPSPSGSFQIINLVENPTYYRKGKVIPPGPENPVGNRWIGLSQKGYGIHGTNAPKSIGQAASHGCIRMAKADIEDLFNRVRTGDVVIIRAERDQLTAQLFGGDTQVIVASADRAVVDAVAGGR